MYDDRRVFRASMMLMTYHFNPIDAAIDALDRTHIVDSDKRLFDADDFALARVRVRLLWRHMYRLQAAVGGAAGAGCLSSARQVTNIAGGLMDCFQAGSSDAKLIRTARRTHIQSIFRDLGLLEVLTRLISVSSKAVLRTHCCSFHPDPRASRQRKSPVSPPSNVSHRKVACTSCSKGVILIDNIITILRKRVMRLRSQLQ